MEERRAADAAARKAQSLPQTPTQAVRHTAIRAVNLRLGLCVRLRSMPSSRARPWRARSPSVPPKPTLDDLQAMEDQVASMSRSAINSLVKIKGMTTARVKKAVENEFIDGVTASKLTKKVDDVFDKYVKLVKLHSIKKRQKILGSYYEPKDGEESNLLPEVKKLKPLPKRPDK